MNHFLSLFCATALFAVFAMAAQQEEVKPSDITEERAFTAVRRVREAKMDDASEMVAVARQNADGSTVQVLAGLLRRRRDLCSQACVCTRRRRDILPAEQQADQPVDQQAAEDVRKRRDCSCQDACQTECVCVDN